MCCELTFSLLFGWMLKLGRWDNIYHINASITFVVVNMQFSLCNLCYLTLSIKGFIWLKVMYLSNKCAIVMACIIDA